MNILVVAPHADDEVLGCGASIARHVAAGDKVAVAIMTNASLGAPEIFPVAAVETARREAQRAHALLGVQRTVFFDFPAPRLDQYPRYKISQSLGEAIAEFRPETVYVPHRGDLHHDHAVVFGAALVACRPLAQSSVRNIYAYETLSETEWGHPFGDDAFIPDHFVEVSSVFSKKLDAMRCFASQLKDSPHPRSLDAMDALARFRGATISVKHAEAFMTVRTVLRE
ncbi:PIG-L deacetylase family protein [Noviherbaspirillum sp.]|jgi:LmbE family N-acetylglucosaminyl deacetylase|uniref:PIG-L deacetylase family protein n=1 Tax=Noviherbaspirillum sp. TaxID=1926288 RepID=UPI0025D1F51F|nr:PIG-L deacetylase family protein [Noviherbaspirillum sp.]